MASEKIYLIHKTSEGQYEDYRESITIDEFDTPGAALDAALEKGLVITDKLGLFDRSMNAAILLKGVLGSTVINFRTEESEEGKKCRK